jgi:hypothetical protein
MISPNQDRFSVSLTKQGHIEHHRVKHKNLALHWSFIIKTEFKL